MSRKGRLVEILVRHLEHLMALEGIKVTCPELFYKNKTLIGEVDITLRGNIGSSSIFIGIECRDRPENGKQGIPWIREIRGKQEQLKVDKMVAVSTTGFTHEAQEIASEWSIDLLTLQDAEDVEISNWFMPTKFELKLTSYELRGSPSLTTIPPLAHKGIKICSLRFKREGFNNLLSLNELIKPEIEDVLESFNYRHDVDEAHVDIQYRLPINPFKVRILKQQVYVERFVIPITVFRTTAHGGVVLSAYKRSNDSSVIGVAGVSKLKIRNRELKAIICAVRKSPNSPILNISGEFLTEDDKPYLMSPLEINIVTKDETKNKLK